MAVGSAALEHGRDLHDRPRYMTQQALQPSQMPSQPVSATELSFIASSAGKQGAIAAAASGALSGALVYALTAFSPRFRALTPSASIKTALVVSPMFAAFFYKSHLVIGKATRDPRAFLSAAPAAPQRMVQQHLAPWQAAANIVYEHPLKTILGVAAPLYGAIFFKESTHPSTANMILSQRLIHTRVYGQAIAIMTTIGVMSFGDAMKEDGSYVIDENGYLTRSNHLSTKPKSWQRSVGDAETVDKRELGSTSPKYSLLVPLLYAPLLPLTIIGLRGRLSRENITRVVAGAVSIVLIHAGSIMFSDSTVGIGRPS